MADVLIKVDENEVDVNVDSSIHSDVRVDCAGEIKFLLKKVRKSKIWFAYNSGVSGDDGVVERRSRDCGVENEPVARISYRHHTAAVGPGVEDQVFTGLDASAAQVV